MCICACVLACPYKYLCAWQSYFACVTMLACVLILEPITTAGCCSSKKACCPSARTHARSPPIHSVCILQLAYFSLYVQEVRLQKVDLSRYSPKEVKLANFTLTVCTCVCNPLEIVTELCHSQVAGQTSLF